MKYDPRFLQILIWETLENAPMLIGFLMSVYTRSKNLLLAFFILLVGTCSSAALIHFTESKKYSNQPSLKETIVNFIVFTALSIPFVFYVSNDNTWWSNWFTDIILGVLTGMALSYGESRGWASTATTKVHALSMAIAVVLFLYGIRFTSTLEPVFSVLLVGVVFNIFISIIIVLIDYWPIKESSQMTDSTTKLPDIKIGNTEC